MTTDVARERYSRLMMEIESLEDEIEKIGTERLEKNGRKTVPGQVLESLKEQLAVKKNELARISDGCGKPHAH